MYDLKFRDDVAPSNVGSMDSIDQINTSETYNNMTFSFRDSVASSIKPQDNEKPDSMKNSVIEEEDYCVNLNSDSKASVNDKANELHKLKKLNRKKGLSYPLSPLKISTRHSAIVDENATPLNPSAIDILQNESTRESRVKYNYCSFI